MKGSKKVAIVGNDERAEVVGKIKEAIAKVIPSTAIVTTRQAVARLGEIINERPEVMSYEEYKRIRRNQTKLLKNAKRR